MSEISSSCLPRTRKKKEGKKKFLMYLKFPWCLELRLQKCLELPLTGKPVQFNPNLRDSSFRTKNIVVCFTEE